ncbi:MAG: nuclear transport factor 2 family protein [Flavobacteriaceae bacterium]
MKKITTILLASSFSVMSFGQYVQKSSCNKNASKISNMAIENAINLEFLIALGAANAALAIDSDCGCAQLVKAFISSNNKDWGSRQEKLNKINRVNLSGEEKVWFDVLSAENNDKAREIQKEGAEKFPNSPLVNYLATSSKDMESYKNFADQFPDYASAAYNMMSYGYLRGDFGKEDKVAAMKFVEKSQKMHDGPNGFDSMAEHYASLGDYDKALENQLKAFDYAVFASPYQNYARIYWSKKNQSKLEEQLMQSQKDMQQAIIDQDYEAYLKFLDNKTPVTTGDSNLQPFYLFDKKAFDRERKMTWNTFELQNIDVAFSPDMNAAVLTFYGKGSYTMNGASEKTNYSTRGSSTWIRTQGGWKIMHNSWAPNQGENGIPKI